MGHSGVMFGDMLGGCTEHMFGTHCGGLWGTYLGHIGDIIEDTMGTHGDDLGTYLSHPIVVTSVALGFCPFHVPVPLCVPFCPMPPPPCLLCPHSPGGQASPGSHQEE